MGLRVVVALFVLAGNAYAQHSESMCFRELWFPTWNAKDVPINTKLWHIGPRVIDVDRTELVNAAPNTEYSPHIHRWTFETGASRDDTPPTRPLITRVSFVVGRPLSLEGIARSVREQLETNSASNNDRVAVEQITIRGGWDADTALLRVEIYDRLGLQVVYIPPPAIFTSPGFTVTPDNIKVVIRAVDLADNESEPVEIVPVVTVETVDPDRCNPPTPERCGTGAMFSFLLAGAGVFGLLLGVLVIAYILRSRVRLIPGEPISLLVAEAVVRLVQRRRMITTAISISVLIALVSQDYIATAFLFSLVPLIKLGQLVLARNLLRRIELAGAAAERRGNWLYIANDPLEPVYIRASRSIFAAAKRSNVPKSIQL